MMAFSTVPAFTEPPSSTDNANFRPRANAYNACFPAFVSAMNALAGEIDAHLQAAHAAGGAACAATSTTSLTVGAGAKTIQINSGKGFTPGQYVVIWSEAAQAGMLGRVTAHVPASDAGDFGVLTIDVREAVGTGTFAAWSVFVVPFVASQIDLSGGEFLDAPVTVGGVAKMLRDTHGRFAIPVLPTYNFFSPHLMLPADTDFSRLSQATRTNAAARIEVVAVDEPRFEIDPSGQCVGLLCERVGANMFSYSEQFDNAIWIKTRASVVQNAATAPNGTVTAAKLVEDNTVTNNHYIGRNAVFVAGTTYTMSFFVRALERSECTLSLPEACFGPDAYARFNLLLGTMIPGGAITARMRQYPDGWWRVSITATAVTSGSGMCVMFLVAGTNSYSGDGASGLYLWGAQCEADSATSSYIPAVSSTTTRVGDVCTIDLSRIDFNHAEGTVFVRARTPSSLGSFPKAVELARDAGNRIVVDRQHDGIIRGVVYSGGVVTGAVNFGVIAADTDFAVALSYRSGTLCGIVNGYAEQTGICSALPTGLLKLTIGGSMATDSAGWGGAVQHVAYFPRALSAAQRRAMVL